MIVLPPQLTQHGPSLLLGRETPESRRQSRLPTLPQLTGRASDRTESRDGSVPDAKIQLLEPTFFGEPPLFGLYHAAFGPQADRRRGVLLCPPIGHEHTRSHRALKTLAESLARAGHHVLRFDYRGIGDSSGDSAEGGLGPWRQDVLQALEELEDLSGVKEVQIVGLRLGAALAVAAAAARVGRPRPPRVTNLLLWDPVLSGDQFLEVSTSLMSSFLNDPARFPALERDDRARIPKDSLLGYSYPDELRHSLRELDLRQVAPWPALPTAVVLSEHSSACGDLVQRLRSAGCRVACDEIQESAAKWSEYARPRRPCAPEGSHRPSWLVSERPGGERARRRVWRRSVAGRPHHAPG